MPESPSHGVTLAPIYGHLFEHILLLGGNCGMVISAMPNIAIIIITLTIDRNKREPAYHAIYA